MCRRASDNPYLHAYTHKHIHILTATFRASEAYSRLPVNFFPQFSERQLLAMIGVVVYRPECPSTWLGLGLGFDY